MRFLITQRAREDLVRELSQTALDHGTESMESSCAGLFKNCVDILNDHPRLGHQFHLSTKDREIRRLVFGMLHLFYELAEDTITIVAIQHKDLLPQKMMATGPYITDFEAKIEQVERKFGGKLPPDYVHWLKRHQPGPDDHAQTPYCLEQLINTQILIQDVLPQGMLAIGGDGYGNQVLFDSSTGGIEWWNHEREPDDQRTETIRPTFSSYLELIAKGEV